MSNPNTISSAENNTYQLYNTFTDLKESIEAFDDFVNVCSEGYENYQLIKSLVYRLNSAACTFEAPFIASLPDGLEKPAKLLWGPSTDSRLVNPNKTV